MRKRYLHDTYGANDLFWDRNWDQDWKQKLSTPPPVMHRLVSRMMKYLRPGMVLLEGGCGDGRYVRYFTDLGIKTVGVDFARTTIQTINDLLPNLDVRVGDIRKLEFPDEHFDAYYSGGVVEHFEDGVALQLTEAHRVLRAGGYFFVTVPHMNFIRLVEGALFRPRKKIDLDGRISYYKEGVREFVVEVPPDCFHFHEYFFTSQEMRIFLATHGFNIIEEMCFSSIFGLCDIEMYRRLIRADHARRSIINKIFAIPLKSVRSIEERNSIICSFISDKIGIFFGNLKLYVCRRNE